MLIKILSVLPSMRIDLVTKSTELREIPISQNVRRSL